jgi:hypothetical protein
MKCSIVSFLDNDTKHDIVLVLDSDTKRNIVLFCAVLLSLFAYEAPTGTSADDAGMYVWRVCMACISYVYVLLIRLRAH